MSNTSNSKKKSATNKQTDKTKKKIVTKAKKHIKKHRGLQIAIVLVVVAIIVAVLVMYFVKPSLFDFLKPNKTKDVKGITPIVGEKLEMQVIDVGQGDSILITLPDGKNMLIDIGSEFRTPSCWGAVDSALKEKDIKTIDYMFVTHTDYDHTRELAKLCKNYEIKNFYLPNIGKVMSETWNDALPIVQSETYRDGSSDIKSTITYNLGSYAISGAEWKMDCYSFSGEEAFYKNMDNDSSAENKNAISPICVLEYAGRSICLTGDANDKTEEYILSQGYLDNIDVDVLKVGHHGSRSSTTSAFLNKIDPEFAIVSASKDNGYGHPHPELVARLEQYKDIISDSDYNGFGDKTSYRIYNTAVDGTCTVQIGKNGTLNVISDKNEDSNRTIVAVVLYNFENNNICLLTAVRKDAWV